MNNIPKVSVVMPVYNQEKYIKKGVQSILSQTFKDFELIIINDGSTDNTLDIIEKFQKKDKRVKIINHKNNKGIVCSLNEGIKKSKGKYIARMDGDDISEPDRFTIQHKFLESNLDVSVVGSWIRTFGSSERVWKTSNNPEEIRTRMLFESAIAHPSVMMRREFLLENKLFYRDEYRDAEDYDLWVRVAEISKISNIQKVLLKYRVHEEQTTRTQILSLQNNSVKVRSIQLKKLGINPNKKQSNLHLRIGGWKETKDVAELYEVKKWIEKLHISNKEKNEYETKLFENLLSERWLGIVYLSNGIGSFRWLMLFTIKPTLSLRVFSVAFVKLFKKYLKRYKDAK